MIIAAVMFISVGCSSSKNVTKAQLEDKWVLKTINNMPANQVFRDKVPYMIFNFGIEQVSGNAGCNVFSGKFIYENGMFNASNLITTQMACLNGNDEAVLLQLLNKPSKLSLMNGDLLFAQEGQPVLVFTRAKPLGAADLVGTWKLQSLEGKSVDDTDLVPTLEFDFVGKKISGNAGCNTYNAPFTLSKNVINIKPMITTRMACDKMDQENSFVNALKGRVDIDIENNNLVLRRDNKTIMVFTR